MTSNTKTDRVGPHSTDLKATQQGAFFAMARAEGYDAEMKGTRTVTVWCTFEQYNKLLDGFGLPIRQVDRALGYKEKE
jgi:hypothetical protein